MINAKDFAAEWKWMNSSPEAKNALMRQKLRLFLN